MLNAIWSNIISVNLIKQLKCLLVFTMLLYKRWILCNHWVNQMTWGWDKTCRKIIEVDTVWWCALVPETLSGQMYGCYLRQEGTCLGTDVTDITLAMAWSHAWLCRLITMCSALNLLCSVVLPHRDSYNVPGWCLVSYVYLQPVAHYHPFKFLLHSISSLFFLSFLAMVFPVF